MSARVGSLCAVNPAHGRMRIVQHAGVVVDICDECSRERMRSKRAAATNGATTAGVPCTAKDCRGVIVNGACAACQKRERAFADVLHPTVICAACEVSMPRKVGRRRKDGTVLCRACAALAKKREKMRARQRGAA